MTPLKLLRTAIVPALQELAPLGVPGSAEAQRLLLAIALQESGLRHRRQVGAAGDEDGPAASFWQFEKGGGCKGVLAHRLTAAAMDAVCESYNVLATPQGLWEAIRYQDIVAACAARLLVRTLPNALPLTAEQGWLQYLSAWRPGKPRPDTWIGCWELADATVKGEV